MRAQLCQVESEEFEEDKMETLGGPAVDEAGTEEPEPVRELSKLRSCLHGLGPQVADSDALPSARQAASFGSTLPGQSTKALQSAFSQSTSAVSSIVLEVHVA